MIYFYFPFVAVKNIEKVHVPSKLFAPDFNAFVLLSSAFQVLTVVASIF